MISSHASSLKTRLWPFIACAVALYLILTPTSTIFRPAKTEEAPWLFKFLALWGERQANLAWHRGGPEEKPEGFLNLAKYHAERQLALSAVHLRPIPNYQLASAWYRFSLTLNHHNLQNWRLVTFLSALTGNAEIAKKTIKAALEYFPNHPLLLLERSCSLGDFVHPRIHLMWAEEAYNSFRTMENKPAVDLQDTRMFFMEYMRAIRRTDYYFNKPENRRKVIQLYQEMAQYDLDALTRSPVYKDLIAKENAQSHKAPIQKSNK